MAHTFVAPEEKKAGERFENSPVLWSKEKQIKTALRSTYFEFVKTFGQSFLSFNNKLHFK